MNDVAVCQPDGQIAGLPEHSQLNACVKNGAPDAISYTHNSIYPICKIAVGKPGQLSLVGSRLGRNCTAHNDPHTSLLYRSVMSKFGCRILAVDRRML